MLRSLFVLLLCSATSACQSSIVVDAGPQPDAGGPTGRLTLESEPSVTLAFGEQAEVAVRYTEGDAPVSGVEVRFALEGRAHDSTLLERDLAVLTNADGRARISLLAGSVAAAFRVRASSDRAAPIYVDVSIGNMGFGGLTIGAVYSGRREGAVRRVVELYSEMDCATLAELPPFPDRTMTLEDAMVGEVSFVALPAGISYAILGRVEGADGATLATACADGIVIVAEQETRVDLAFEDAPLVIEGGYDVELAIAPSTTSTWAADLAAAAGLARVELAGSGASLYLDALDQELRDRGEVAAADALLLERTVAVGSLTTQLDAAGVGPSVAVVALAGRVNDRLTRIAIGGPLAIDTELAVSWMPASIAAGAIGDPDSPPLILDPASIVAQLAPSIELAWQPETDVLDVPSLTLTLPLGTLILATLEAEAAATGASDPSALLVDGAGCDVLASWIAEDPTLAPVCDASCAEASCTRALGTVMDAIDAALLSADAARSAISLTGTVTARDINGDLTVDLLTGTGLTGEWSDALAPGDPIGGEITGARVLP